MKEQTLYFAHRTTFFLPAHSLVPQSLNPRGLLGRCRVGARSFHDFAAGQGSLAFRHNIIAERGILEVQATKQRHPGKLANTAIGNRHAVNTNICQ